MNLSENKYIDTLSLWNKAFRVIFKICWFLVGVFMPGRSFSFAKRFVINLFGGDCESGSVIYSSCLIFDPRNLVMKSNSTLGPKAIIYNVDKIVIGKGSVISQYSHLNTASHDFRSHNFPLIHEPIVIGDNCWIATDVYVSMGVSICDGTIVGARSSIFKSIQIPGIYVGSPALKVEK